jgi:HEPN domain-containing protein
MAVPKSADARLYYRAAKQRYDDAEWLLEGNRTTAAVYLAGYTIECILKALLLANVATGLRDETLAEFRGSRAHNIEWLGAMYRRHVGVGVPREITQVLSRIASWSTDLRYAAGTLERREATDFLAAVVAFAKWADGRM